MTARHRGAATIGAMGTLYLVRHGQASFGADDYDNLSPLGHRQARRLGAYWRQCLGPDLTFDAVLIGTLRRQRQTWQGIAEGAGLSNVPQVSWPGLNEYDGDAVIAAVQSEPLVSSDTPEGYRAHFQALRRGLNAWMRGEVTPAGMPTYAQFVHGVVAALDHVRRQYSGNVLLVSSGGPITTAVGHVLQVPPAVTIEMNLRYRNTAVTELVFNPKRHSLVAYNALPHLAGAGFEDWVTYA